MVCIDVAFPLLVLRSITMIEAKTSFIRTCDKLSRKAIIYKFSTPLCIFNSLYSKIDLNLLYTYLDITGMHMIYDNR